jgi:short-subunit dehydrogenase
LPLKVIQLDVDDENSVREAIQTINSEKNRIDVLINNAGYGTFGSLEDLTIDEIKSQFETNFFGVVGVIKQVLPIIRRLDSKRTIANISSVGGCI